MRVAFRADASSALGLGHVMRCLTLARALRALGASVDFVCRELAGHPYDLIEAPGISVRRLPTRGPAHEPVSPEQPDAAWSADADETRAALEGSGSRPHWLVVDSYALDERWERALSGAVGRVMVIDDLANRPHSCDALLDQNLVADMSTRYDALVGPTCQKLLGPTYALLQPTYAELRDRTAARAGQVRRILVSFGGADHGNLTGRVVSAFLALRRPDIILDVVTTSGSPHRAAILAQAAGHANVSVHVSRPTLAPLMAGADLAFGGAGSTSWERLCLGLPSVVIAMATNQEPIARELDRLGLAQLLGRGADVGDAEIQAKLRDLTTRPLDPAWSERCRAVVDGRGAQRLTDQLMNAQEGTAARQVASSFQREPLQ